MPPIIAFTASSNAVIIQRKKNWFYLISRVFWPGKMDLTTALEEAVNAIMGIIYIFAKKVSDWGLLYRRYCKKSMKDSKMVDQTGMKVWSEGYFMNIFYPT